MEELERVLEDLERVFHVHIQWKSVGRGSPSCGLSDRHTFHGCEFCRRVKAEKRRYRLCSENDDILLPRLAGIEKGAFVHTCHAGVSELVVPLFEGRPVHGGVPGRRVPAGKRGIGCCGG